MLAMLCAVSIQFDIGNGCCVHWAHSVRETEKEIRRVSRLSLMVLINAVFFSLLSLFGFCSVSVEISHESNTFHWAKIMVALDASPLNVVWRSGAHQQKKLSVSLSRSHSTFFAQKIGHYTNYQNGFWYHWLFPNGHFNLKLKITSQTFRRVNYNWPKCLCKVNNTGFSSCDNIWSCKLSPVPFGKRS